MLDVVLKLIASKCEEFRKYRNFCFKIINICCIILRKNIKSFFLKDEELF